MDENYNFVGEGLCAKKNKRVYAENSCDDDFECFTLRD
jgi:hypothetical protein